MRDPYALGFSILIGLYVSVEVAIYVWMPTYLFGYNGPGGWFASYALTVFFVLRAAGRFVGAWILQQMPWAAVLALFSVLIFACFAVSLLAGVRAGLFLLPISGLFMSIMYPTMNSKGISCFHKSHHGAVAGVILFFTAASAAIGPLAMAATSDALGDPKYGFALATVFSMLLALGLVFNWLAEPARVRLLSCERADYGGDGRFSLAKQGVEAAAVTHDKAPPYRSGLSTK
jgi:fucose permease